MNHLRGHSAGLADAVAEQVRVFATPSEGLRAVPGFHTRLLLGLESEFWASRLVLLQATRQAAHTNKRGCGSVWLP